MKIVLVIVLLCAAPLVPLTHAQTIDPEALFHDYCSVCHGDKGDGKSHAQQSMAPPPRDFTSLESALELNKPRIIHAISEGIPNTAMTGWKSRLSDMEIEAIADLIRNKFMMPTTLETATEGSRIYAEYCSVCHGDSGQGAVWATAGLSPKPADFTSPQFQASMTRDHMIQSVSYGRPETAMTGWKKRLTDKQIETVVDYVINTFMPELGGHKETAVAGQMAADGHAHTHTHADPDMELSAYLGQPLAEGLQGNPERGENLYKNNCATCHGEQGDGRGPRAYFINPKPRNFLHTSSRANLNRPTLHRVISKGKLRTEMPAWEKVLNAQQIADLSEYVFVTFIKQ